MSLSSSIQRFYKWFILFNVMIGTFMVVLDTTVINTALTTIMGDLGCSINKAEWILTGYMLSMAAILPVTGWLTDYMGIKNLFMLSIGVFTCGSLMCGNTHTIEELIFWRIIQGLGSGIVVPAGMVIVTNVFPLQQRGLALGFWAVASAASVSFGPMIGGYIVDNLNWNYIFYINVPIGIFCVLFTYAVQEKVSTFIKRSFDIGGFITSILFLPVFLYGLSQVTSGTNTKGWSDPIVLACMWISLVSFVTFLFIENRSKSPLINLHILKDHNFSFANIVVFIFGIGMFGSAFLTPLYVQESLSYSAYQTGLLFLPVGMLQAFASPLAGILSRHIDPRIVIITGLLILGISFYMNGFLSTGTNHQYIMVSLCLRGVGMGILYPPLINMSLYTIPKKLISEASSVTNILRQVGGSFGVALFSHLIAQREAMHFIHYSDAINFTEPVYEKTIDGMSTLFSERISINANEIEEAASQVIIREVHTDAFIQSINDVFLIGLVLTVLAILFVFFLRKQKHH